MHYLKQSSCLSSWINHSQAFDIVDRCRMPVSMSFIETIKYFDCD